MSNTLVKKDIEIKGGLVNITSLSEAMQYAQSIVKSGLAPASFKTPEAVLVAMQHGAELGLKPLASLQHISVINGRPALYGKALPGVILATGLMEEFDETIEGTGDNMVAICRAKRKGIAKSRTERFSVADAKRARLWGKSGPWTLYPKDMLKYKSRARTLGSLFADVLCGIAVYEDIQDVEATKVDSEPPLKTDPLMADITEEATESRTIDDADFELSEGNYVEESEYPTKEQVKKLFVVLEKSGNTVEQFKDFLLREYSYQSTSEIKKNNYDEIYKWCANEPPVEE